MAQKPIAFLTRSLVDATGRNMWKGLVSSCKAAATPIITFRANVLNTKTDSIIYHLIDDNYFSGMISWASSDVNQKTLDFYGKYYNIPMVGITFKVPERAVIFAENKSGMNELMDHLILTHQFTKIAFVRGPETHVYAKDRYQAYLDSLKRHNIQIDENLISPPGAWDMGAGAKGVQALLDRGLTPGKDFQAVVCVGDNVAIGALNYLQSKGFSIPFDVVVTGFNGTKEAASCNPPLTTVEMPFFGIGKKSFQMLHDGTDEEFHYNTRLLIAESCGCTSATLRRAVVNHRTPGLLGKKKIHKNQATFDSKWTLQTRVAITTMVSANTHLEPSSKEYVNSTISSFIQSLIDTFTSDDEFNSSPFLKLLGKALSGFNDESSDFTIWQDIISVLRNAALEVIQNTPLELDAENLFTQARIQINEIDERYQRQSALNTAIFEGALRNISNTLLSTYETSELMNIIAQSIKKLGIPGVFIALYDKCTFTLENDQVPPSSKLLLAVRDGNRIDLPMGGVPFQTAEIVPEQFRPKGDFYSLVVESLHFQNELMGYIVFQQGPADGTAYATLRDQLSSSLYVARLMTARAKDKDKLENVMNNMSDKADLVSDKSKQISDNIGSISGTMGNFAQSIKDISDNIKVVASTVQAADEKINLANREINDLVESTKKIENAVYMINDVAEQTSVLALNASIEAAHAGEAGRGFSVVAKEVKTLAAQTVNSTSTISDLVKANSINAQSTKTVIDTTNDAIKRIAKLSESIQETISAQVQSSADISSQIRNVSAGTEQISSAIEEIAKLGDEFKK